MIWGFSVVRGTSRMTRVESWNRNSRLIRYWINWLL